MTPELFDSRNVPLLGVFEFMRNLRSIDCSTLFSLQCPPGPLSGFLLALRWLDLSASVTTGLYLNLFIVTACHKFHFFYTPFFFFLSKPGIVPELEPGVQAYSVESIVMRGFDQMSWETSKGKSIV